jgi:hypothetical protein
MRAPELESAEDVLLRARLVDFSITRLVEISTELYELLDSMAEGVVPLDSQERLELEAETLTLFVFYEVAAFMHLFEQWGISAPVDSELNYVVKCRNLFLTHPRHAKNHRGGPLTASHAREGR